MFGILSFCRPTSNNNDTTTTFDLSINSTPMCIATTHNPPAMIKTPLEYKDVCYLRVGVYACDIDKDLFGIRNNSIRRWHRINWSNSLDAR